MNLYRIFLFVVSLFIFVIPDLAHSASIKVIAAKDGKVIVSLSGEIAEGDVDAFRAELRKVNDSGKLVSGVRLNSVGGSLLEGVKLAEAVKFAKIASNVASNATCASACFLVFAAGDTKYVNYTARVGVHGASDRSGNETQSSNAATVSMAKVAKELGVPPAIIGRMVVTPPSEMVWLSPADLQSMGATMVGKPNQVAVDETPRQLLRPQTSSQEPMDLKPQLQAKRPLDWESFVDEAVRISANQNNGKPQANRLCQPEFKVCSNAIFFVIDQTSVMLRATRDMNDRIVKREFCSFNASEDIRICLDWDSKEKRRDMKDASGNWSKIADE